MSSVTYYSSFTDSRPSRVSLTGDDAHQEILTVRDEMTERGSEHPPRFARTQEEDSRRE